MLLQNLISLRYFSPLRHNQINSTAPTPSGFGNHRTTTPTPIRCNSIAPTPSGLDDFHMCTIFKIDFPETAFLNSSFNRLPQQFVQQLQKLIRLSHYIMQLIGTVNRFDFSGIEIHNRNFDGYGSRFANFGGFGTKSGEKSSEFSVFLP